MQRELELKINSESIGVYGYKKEEEENEERNMLKEEKGKRNKRNRGVSRRACRASDSGKDTRR